MAFPCYRQLYFLCCDSPFLIRFHFVCSSIVDEVFFCIVFQNLVQYFSDLTVVAVFYHHGFSLVSPKLLFNKFGI